MEGKVEKIVEESSIGSQIFTFRSFFRCRCNIDRWLHKREVDADRNSDGESEQRIPGAGPANHFRRNRFHGKPSESGLDGER